jgi:hypothetical protein
MLTQSFREDLYPTTHCCTGAVSAKAVFPVLSEGRIRIVAHPTTELAKACGIWACSAGFNAYFCSCCLI